MRGHSDEAQQEAEADRNLLRAAVTMRGLAQREIGIRVCWPMMSMRPDKLGRGTGLHEHLHSRYNT